MVLASLVGLAYANSFHAQWHFDDELNIVQNRYIHILSLNPASLWRAMIQDGRQNRPFSNLSFALNYYFNGENVRGYHFVNAAFHWLASLAVFALLRLTFRRAGLPADRRDWAALAASAAWAVHPIQTQAVTYIVQRQTVMASAFMLCTLVAYVLGRQEPGRRRRLGLYVLAGISMILAVGSKEIAVITPALIFIYELYFFQDLSPAFLRRHQRALLPAVLVLLVLGWVYLRPQMQEQIALGFQRYHFTMSERLLSEPRVLFEYVGLILLPLRSRLTLEHYPALSASIVSPWSNLPAVLGWIALLFLAVRFAPRHRLLSFACWWYLLNLALESSFFPLDLMAEHRLYLPSLAVLAPLLAGPLLLAPRLGRGLIWALLLALLLLAGTVARNSVWQTELKLWRDCVRKEPLKPRAHYGLAKAFLEAGQYESARREYERTLAFNPEEPACYFSLGVVAEREGRPDLAVPYYQTALGFQPDYAAAMMNLGILYSQARRYDEAEKLLRRSAALEPLNPKAHANLGNLLFIRGRAAEALAESDRALFLDPNLAGVRRQRELIEQRLR